MSRFFRLLSALVLAAMLPCLSWAESVTVKAATLGVNFCKAEHNMSADSSEPYGFYDEAGKRGGLLEERAWVNINTPSGTIDLADTVNSATYRLQWQGGAEWGPPGSAAGKLLDSYLDNAATITLSGLPPSGYDVAILFSGDGGKFSAVTVNGTDKTYDAEGQLVDGSAAWGNRATITTETKTLSATGTATAGNVMYLAGMTAPVLRLRTTNDATAKIRGTIAAIQIYPKPGAYGRQAFDLIDRGATTIALGELGIAPETQVAEVTLADGATLKVDGEVELARLRLRSEGIVKVVGGEGVEALSGIGEFDYAETAGLDIGTLRAKALTARNGKTLAMAALNQVETLTREAGSTLRLTGPIAGDRDALPLQNNTTLETTGDVSLAGVAVDETLQGRSWTLSGGDSRVGQLFLRSGEGWKNPGASGTFALRNGAHLTVEGAQKGLTNNAGENAAMLCVTGGTHTSIIEGEGTRLSAPNGAVSLARDGKAVVTVRDGATFAAYRLGCVANDGGAGSAMTVGNATLTLGKEGATDGLLKFTNGFLTLNDGAALSAKGDWGVDAATAASALTATGIVTVRPEGHTITLRKMSGTGRLAVEGPGTVAFAEGMSATGGLSVAENATVNLGTWRPTLTAIAQGAAIALTPTSAEVLDLRLPLAPGVSTEGVTITVEGWDGVELRQDGDTLVVAKPSAVATWSPTDENAAWDDLSLWENVTAVPTSGQVALDYRALTAPKTVAIPAGTAFESVVLQGADVAKCALTLTLGEGAALGTLTVAGNVTVPLEAVNANANGVSIGERRTLTVDVGAEDGALSVALSGEGAFAKRGAGTLTLNAAVTAMGGATVAEGTLRFGTATVGGGSYSSAGNVTVATEATLDAAGKKDAWLNTVTLHEGATYANSGAAIGSGVRQLRNLVLEGDAAVVATGDCGLIASNYNPGLLTLNGHTLTKRGAGAFWLCNTTVSSGTLRVEEGKFQAVAKASAFTGPMTFDADADNAFDLSGQTVTLSGALTKRGTGAMTFPGVISGNGALTVEAGTLTLTAANTRNASAETTIETGATLDVSAASARLYGMDFGGKPDTKTMTVRGCLVARNWAYSEGEGLGNALGALRTNVYAVQLDGGTVRFVDAEGSGEIGMRGFTVTAKGATLALPKGCALALPETETAYVSLHTNGNLTVRGGGALSLLQNQALDGAVTVAEGTTLSGSGTIQGVVTLEAGAALDASAEVLTVGGLALPEAEGAVTLKAAPEAAKGAEVLRFSTPVNVETFNEDAFKVEGPAWGVAPNAEGSALILTFVATFPDAVGSDGGELTEAAAEALFLAAERLGVPLVSSVTGRSGGRDLTAAELSGALECFRGEGLVQKGEAGAEGTALIVAYEFGIADAVYDHANGTLTVAARVQGGTFAPGTTVELYFTNDGAVAATAAPEAGADTVALTLGGDAPRACAPRPFKVRAVRR